MDAAQSNGTVMMTVHCCMVLQGLSESLDCSGVLPIRCDEEGDQVQQHVAGIPSSYVSVQATR